MEATGDGLQDSPLATSRYLRPTTDPEDVISALEWRPQQLDDAPAGQKKWALRVIQTPGVTLVLFEEFDVFRQIVSDGRTLPLDASPAVFGYSVAHWKGQAFVVESAGFSAYAYLDGSGHPDSSKLRISERYRRPISVICSSR
jgi:hypothetical protein